MRDTNLVNALRLKCGGGKKMERDVIGAMRTAFEQSADRIVAAEEYALVLKKEIEKLRAQLPRWIPVEERLPEYGVRVLATDMYEEDDCIGIWTRKEYPDDPEDGCWIDDRGWWHAFDDVTHWMPLPDRPEVEKALEALKDE